MIVPNKFITFDESILAKISYLIEEDLEEIPLSNLIQNNINKFADISELLMALDVLYALGKIDLDEKTRTVKYVN